MPGWLRVLLAIVAGFIAWFIVATIGNLAIRSFLPGYADVEKAMTFSLPMLFARLVLGAISSLAAGVVCAAIARGARVAVYVLSVLLLALFIPVHVNLLDKFPMWYHLVFLGSLVPLVILGARLLGRVRASEPVKEGA